MRRSKRLLHAGAAATLHSRVANLARPGIEAALLAAVALGVAQAGWSILSPNTAGAASASNEDYDSARTAEPQVAMRTPFAPEAAAMDAQSHAVAALLANVQLAGVRMSLDPTLSGAVLTLDGGDQRAFTVGEEIAGGVRLTEVGADYVLLAYQGGQRQISLPRQEGFSFARALMGQAQLSPSVMQVSASLEPAPIAARAPQATASDLLTTEDLAAHAATGAPATQSAQIFASAPAA
ncbi:MAG: type II secretion system protein N, partial [Hyphomonadaceae bacterium]